MNIIHITVAGHNHKVREAVMEVIRETFLAHGYEVKADTKPPSRYNPFAVLWNAPETEIRVEER